MNNLDNWLLDKTGNLKMSSWALETYNERLSWLRFTVPYRCDSHRSCRCLCLSSIIKGVQYQSLLNDRNAVLVFVLRNCHRGASSSDWSRKSLRKYCHIFKSNLHKTRDQAVLICSQGRDFCPMCVGGLWVMLQNTLSPQSHKCNLFRVFFPVQPFHFLAQWTKYRE